VEESKEGRLTLSAVRNVQRKGAPKPIRTPIRERGQVKHGEKPKFYFSNKIPDVSFAEIQAKYRITKDSTYMVKWNISDCVIQRRTVPPVIEVCIEVTFNAVDVEKLIQNEKVNSAMGVLIEALKRELFTEESTGKENKIKSTLIKINLPTDGRKNTKKKKTLCPVGYHQAV
jgi:hypothetical protein